MAVELPPGERRNKVPIYVGGVTNARGFLRWLREATNGNGRAEMRGDQLILTPDTADCYRSTITALRTLPKEKGVVFHTFTPPADRSVRLLVKNLGRTMPIDDIMEELQSSGIEGVAVTQLRSSRRDQDPAKDRQPTPHFIVTVARGPMVAKLRALEVLCGLTVKVETYNAPKGPLQCKHCQRFGHTRRNCGHSPRCVACGEEHASGTCKTPREDIRCCNCNESTTANYRGRPRYNDAKTNRKTGPKK